jgi:hypothetical protein
MVLGQRGSGGRSVDGGGPDAPPTARWLAFAAACLLVVALVSAGVIGWGDGSSSDAVVSAAGAPASTVGAPSTVTVPPPSTVPPAAAAPSSTIRTTTTLPRAASEVLRAIGTTAPPTTRPAPTTTTPAPVTTVTTRPPTTTTSSTLPRQATISATSVHDSPFVVTVNTGLTFNLAKGETKGPEQVTLPVTGDDVIEVRAAGDASCIVQGQADYFQPGGKYLITVCAGAGAPFTNHPAPVFEVTTLP